MNNSKKTLLSISICIVLVAAIAYLTGDIICTKLSISQIKGSFSGENLVVDNTVNSPESILWVDNINTELDLEYVLEILKNYLDGINLKVIAFRINNDSNIVCRATSDDWAESTKCKSTNKIFSNKCFEIFDEEAREILSKGVTVSTSGTPKLNYTVELNELPLSSFHKKFLYSDEVTIKDNVHNKIIARSKRLMRYYYRVEPRPVGGCISMTKLHHEPIFGLGSSYSFDDQVLLGYAKPTNIIKNLKCKKSFKSSL